MVQLFQLFIIIAHLRWTSSEISKCATGVTAGLFQKHFIFEHPNKTKPGLGFGTLLHPSIFLLNPSCELSNIRSYTLQQYLVFYKEKNLRKISKVSISKVRVKNLLLLILKIFWCLAVLSLLAPPGTGCTQKLLNV